MSGQTALDLDRKVCHVCGEPLTKNLEAKKEWCTNVKCQVYNIMFNIPFKIGKVGD